MKKFFTAFIYAFKGIVSGFIERNMRFHGVMASIVIFLGFILKLESLQWYIVLFLIGAVWSAELFNTAIEELADLIKEHESLDYEATRRVRDVAAGAVLVVAAVSAIIGGWIFYIRLVELFF